MAAGVRAVANKPRAVGTVTLVATSSVAAKLLGAGQAYLLVGLLLGNGALAVRRWLNERHRRRFPRVVRETPSIVQ